LEEKATKKNLAPIRKRSELKKWIRFHPIFSCAVLFSDPTSEKRTKRERLNFFLERKTLPKKNLTPSPEYSGSEFSGTTFGLKIYASYFPGFAMQHCTRHVRKELKENNKSNL